MRCSCKCGCGQARANMNICPNCNKHVCYAECYMYQRCHWCLSYPEDTAQDCLACGEDFPRSEQRCRRCTAPLCVACESRENLGLCTRCSNWLVAEMNSAATYTNCPICDIELDQFSLERCLKCHAAKCQECDLDQTICIICATRTAIHKNTGWI